MHEENDDILEQVTSSEYKYGFVTDIEADEAPRGLSEDTVRFISAKKNEPAWMLAYRLKAYKHWLTMEEPKWPNVEYPPINYQDIIYYSAPKQKIAPDSLDDIDPELRKTFEKLGISLNEQKRLSGVAVDAVIDSVSVATTFKEELSKVGVIFCSMSEAIQEHPELIQKYLGSVVPATDNYFTALNSAVFSDGSFCFIPKGVRCPMELSTYFRINAANTGQFERTLIVAEDEAYVSYLEGCTAPMRDENQLHAAVVEIVAMEKAEVKYSTVQNWYPGDKEGKGGIFNFVTKRGICIPRGALVRFNEWYGAKGPNKGLKLTIEQVAAGILERSKGKRYVGCVADPAIFAEDGGPSRAEVLRRNGVSFKSADNKRVGRNGMMGGWDEMRQRLVGHGGRPMIYTFSTCKDSIRTIPALPHDTTRPEDVNTDAEDHAADEWRYACMSRPWIAPRPDAGPARPRDYRPPPKADTWRVL